MFPDLDSLEIPLPGPEQPQILSPPRDQAAAAGTVAPVVEPDVKVAESGVTPKVKVLPTPCRADSTPKLETQPASVAKDSAGSKSDQVETTGQDGITIPDHEEAKKAEKEKKKAEREQKKASKKAEGPKKRGRKASEKSKDSKGQKKSLKDSDVAEKGSANLGDNLQDQPDQAEAFSSAEAYPVRSRKMKRLKQMSGSFVEEVPTDDEKNNKVKKVGRKKPWKMIKEKSAEDEKDLDQEKAGENQVAGENGDEQQVVQEVEKNEEAPEIETGMDDKKPKKKTAAKSKAKAKAEARKNATEDEKGTRKARGKKASEKTGEKEKKAGRKRPAKKDDQVDEEEKPKRTRSVRKAVVTEVNPSVQAHVAEAKEWERNDRPDPVGEQMMRYADMLKTSHAAAISDQGEPGTASALIYASAKGISDVGDHDSICFEFAGEITFIEFFAGDNAVWRAVKAETSSAAKVDIRCTLLLALTVACGGTYLVEQPRSSLMGAYWRMEWFMTHVRVSQQELAQKQLLDAEIKNQALLARIARLEQEAQQKEKDRDLEKQNETSNLGQLGEMLSKTLARVDELESSLQKVPISADALRMRTRRLCEVKASGKAQVDQATINQYKQGGEQREILEMALLESLARYGLDRSQYRRADFVQRSKIVSERMESKEEEKHGKWYTLDGLRKSKLYGATEIKNIEKALESAPERLPQKLVNLPQPDLKPEVVGLHDALEPFDKSMEESYEKLAGYVTELKMEHQDGKGTPSKKGKVSRKSRKPGSVSTPAVAEASPAEAKPSRKKSRKA
eukprot:s308_g44.t1